MLTRLLTNIGREVYEMNKFFKPIARFARWLFGAPFEELPPEFGDTVPPDLRRFEEQAEEAQHHPRGNVKNSLPARKKRGKVI